MKELIGSIISLVLLVPIIYFLPIGFSKKGKGLLVLTAFIFANLALIAKLSFPFWQSLLLILLLITFSAYFIDKRLGRMIYDTSVNVENGDVLENLDIPTPYQKSSEEIMVGPKVEKNMIVPDSEMALLSEGNEIEPIQQSDPSSLLIDDEPFEMEEIKTISEMNFSNNQVMDQVKEDSSMDDVAAFLNSREAIDSHKEEQVPSVEDQDNQNMDYMAEIENLLQREDLDDFQTDEHDETERKIESRNVEDYLELDETFISTSDDIQDPEFVSADKEVAPAMENFFIEEELEDIVIQEQESEEYDITILEKSSQEDEMDSQNEMYSIEEESHVVVNGNLVELEDELIELNQSLLSNDDLQVMIADHNQIEHEGSAEKQENLDESLTLQQQVFTTIIQQLQIARKQMDSQEFEALIIEHLHEGLTAHDYYTLSSLLIQHYVINKETDKLKNLLFILKEKFNQYPILEMEIQYLYNHYCIN